MRPVEIRDTSSKSSGAIEAGQLRGVRPQLRFALRQGCFGPLRLLGQFLLVNRRHHQRLIHIPQLTLKGAV